MDSYLINFFHKYLNKINKIYKSLNIMIFTYIYYHNKLRININIYPDRQ
jgi:hypothetical protein